MAYPIVFSDKFKENYSDLHKNEQKAIDRAVEKLMNGAPNNFPRGLGVDKVEIAKGIKPTVYEARANDDIRITWQILQNAAGPYIFARNVGHHDDTLKKP
jgi:mRNA-degrading endonuclease RelE of RelBE toxin-antitoxin system